MMMGKIKMILHSPIKPDKQIKKKNENVEILAEDLIAIDELLRFEVS